MKIVAPFLSLILLLSSNLYANKAATKLIRQGHYQLIYPGQIVNINFNHCPIPSFEQYAKSVDLLNLEQEAIVKIIKRQLDQLPFDFIQSYMDVNIYPVHLYDEHEYGFYFNNDIVLEIDKIQPGLSYGESVSSALMEQIGAIAFLPHSDDKKIREIKYYFQSFKSEHSIDLAKSSIFDNGYVSHRAAGIDNNSYNVSNEMNTFFAFLMVESRRVELEQYVNYNPNAPLAKKTIRFVDILSILSPNINNRFYFPKYEPQISMPIEVDYEVVNEVVNEVDGEQLLNLHELKSNELYNYPKESRFEAYETRSFEDQYVMTNEVKINDAHITQEFDEMETIFDNHEKEPSKNTNKKKKKKGTGWVILGLVLLTLELLSQ